MNPKYKQSKAKTVTTWVKHTDKSTWKRARTILKLTAEAFNYLRGRKPIKRITHKCSPNQGQQHLQAGTATSSEDAA